MTLRQQSYVVEILDPLELTAPVVTFDGGYGANIVNILEQLTGYGDAEVAYETTAKLLAPGSYIVSSHVPEKVINLTAVVQASPDMAAVLAILRLKQRLREPVGLKVSTYSAGALAGVREFEAYITNLTQPDAINRDLARFSITFLVPSGTDKAGAI